MRLLITGAAGFLGSHLTDRFIAEGYEVVGLDNFITGHPDNVAHLAGNPKFSLIQHDVSTFTYAPGKFDGVLHLASLASPVDYLNYPIKTLKVGAMGTFNTLGIAKANKAKYFLASTSEVYGDPSVHPQVESYWGNVNPIGPRSCYDESKRFAEAATMAYHREHKLDTRIVRIFNTYGPRMQPHDGRVVTNFIVQALTGAPLTVYGDGSQTRSFCYVDDEVEGLYRLFQSGETDPVNVGNPTEFTVGELAAMVVEMTGSASKIDRRPLPQDDPKMRRPDITRAKRILGWQPKVALRDGLRRTIDFFETLPPAQLASRPQPKSAFGR